MKIKQKVFVISIIIGILVLLAIGVSVLFYTSKTRINTETSDSISTTTEKVVENKVTPDKDSDNDKKVSDVTVIENKPRLVVQNCIPIVNTSPGDIDLTNAKTGITNKEEYVYYEVHGYTKDNVVQQMLKCGPVSNPGDIVPRYVGEAWSNINFAYDYIQKSNRCETSNVKVGVNIKYYMPKWNIKEGSIPNAREIWGGFYSILLDHEKHHGQITMEYAKKIQDYLENPKVTDCQLVTFEAEKIMDQGWVAQGQFDTETAHGLIQFKAVFPDEVAKYFPGV
jgi:predicted secreted Zn-dependent protease